MSKWCRRSKAAYTDRAKPKERVGCIFNRSGYPVFWDKGVLRVTLNDKAKVVQHIDWSGYRYGRGSP